MTRPCNCNRVRLGEAYSLDQCRLCYLAAHDGAYRLLWGMEGPATHEPRARLQPTSPATPVPDVGPGKELKLLLAAIGITTQTGCDCNKKAAQMNQWGVEGCRQHRDEIAGWLRDNAAKRGWMDKFQAAAWAAITGVAFQLDMTDRYGSLVDLAIRRAEEAEANRRTS